MNGFRRIHWATGPCGKLVKFNTYIYPTLGLGPGHMQQRSNVVFLGQDLMGFESKILGFQGFLEGRCGRGGFHLIH